MPCAAACRPVEEDWGQREEISVDGEGAVRRLAQLVRIPTVSNYDEAKVDEAPFETFRETLKELYPAVHEACPPVLCQGEGRTTGLFVPLERGKQCRAHGADGTL